MNTQMIPLGDQRRWRDALDGVPHAIAHTNAYQAALAKTTNDEVFLFVYEHEDNKAVCPFAVRAFTGERDIYSPYGFGGFTGVGDLRGLPAAFDAFGRGAEFVAGYTLLHPLLAPLNIPWGEPTTDASTVYLMPLHEDVDVMLGRGTPRRQKRVRRWRRREARIETDITRLEEAFVQMYPDHIDRVGAAAPYRLGAPSLRALVEHPDTFLLGACDDAGAVVTVAMFGTTGPCAEYLYLVQTEDGRRHSEGLLIEAFVALARRGTHWAHLGGGIHGDDGVAAFKRRFGAHAIGGAALKHVFRPDRYAALCEGADPSTAFFPVYHALSRVLLEAA